MKRLINRANAFWTTFVLFTFSASVAHAQNSTVGDRIYSVLNELWIPLFYLITGVCFILGLVVIAKGLLKLKDAGNDAGGARGVVSEGILHLCAGAILLALPSAAGIGVTSWTGTSVNIFGNRLEMFAAVEQTDYGLGENPPNLTLRDTNKKNLLDRVSNIHKPENCLRSSEPTVCLSRNVAKNAVPLAIMGLFAAVFLTGLWMFGSAVHDLAKSNSGANKMLPQGWAAKLVVSILLMNSPFLFGIVSETILGVGGNSVVTDIGFNEKSSLLSYNTGIENQYFSANAELLTNISIILAFFGVWAFVRGLFMIKSTAEGRSNGTYGNGMVYMVAGVLLANIKMSTCTILWTLGGAPGLTNVCS